MATDKKLHFLISNCPGPFRIVSETVHMLEKHGNHFEIELTVKPIEAGIELLGHNNPIKIGFEVVLLGATTKYGHGSDEPRNVRLLGRFTLRGNPEYYSKNFEALDELAKWQWEVVFNPYDRRIGWAAKLDNPLPERWEL